MTVELLSATFAPHIGEDFQVIPAPPGAPFVAVLSACDETADPATHDAWRESVGRVPFALLFHAAAGDHHSQQIFALRHPALGELSLFLVPLGPDERGMRYEAVVS